MTAPVGADAFIGPRGDQGIAPYTNTVGAEIRLAVPEKRCALTLLLAFFDRCGKPSRLHPPPAAPRRFSLIGPPPSLRRGELRSPAIQGRYRI